MLSINPTFALSNAFKSSGFSWALISILETSPPDDCIDLANDSTNSVPMDPIEGCTSNRSSNNAVITLSLPSPLLTIDANAAPTIGSAYPANLLCIISALDLPVKLANAVVSIINS